MKPILLLALSSAAFAVDVHPEPGMALDPQRYNDLRLAIGTSSKLDSADALGTSYEADWQMAPHLGLQWIHGFAGDELGFALGVEVAFDDHRGDLSKVVGYQNLGDGGLWLRTATVALIPMAVLRPDYNDPFDWGPGSVQVELGPVIAAGYGIARIGGSEFSDPTPVFMWGLRGGVVWTSERRWQLGLTLGYEAVSADPDILDQPASLSGAGLVGGLVFGRRL